MGCEAITIAKLPSGLTQLGTSAFEGCLGITAINIPAGVETVGSRAFAGCEAITELTFRSGFVQSKNACLPILRILLGSFICVRDSHA